MTDPQYRRNILILISESASKVGEIVIYLGNPGLDQELQEFEE